MSTDAPVQAQARTRHRIPRHRSLRPQLIRFTAVATLCVMVTAVITAHGSAAVVSSLTTAAPVSQPVADNQKQAETFTERIERIADEETPLLPTPPTEDEADSSETFCVSGEFTSLSVVYNSVTEALIPQLPVEMQATARTQQAASLRDMERLHVSTLAISNSPLALGADEDDPMSTYNTPLSQWVVVQLLKIRDGQETEAIPVSNITLTQAVETVWLYVFATILAPAQYGLGIAPSLGSPFTGAPLLSSITYNTLLSLGLSITRMGLQALYQFTADSIINSCVARVTQEQIDQAGAASEDITYDIAIPQFIRDAANELALADSDTCQPVSALPLSRIVERTAESVQSSVSGEANQAIVAAEANRILDAMRAGRIHHNLIPADPADFTAMESLGATIGGLVPIVGGAPINILIGLGHNFGNGADPFETVSIADLTVTKALTAGYYSYALAMHLFTLVPEAALLPVLGLPSDAFGPFSPIRILTATLNLPLTYGLVTFHNVVRSMCLREDDTTGSGLGAEANRLPSSTPEETAASDTLETQSAS